MKYYVCFSNNVKYFLKIKNIRYVSDGVHDVTGKKFWRYERNAELDIALTEWNDFKNRYTKPTAK